MDTTTTPSVELSPIAKKILVVAGVTIAVVAASKLANRFVPGFPKFLTRVEQNVVEVVTVPTEV